LAENLFRLRIQQAGLSEKYACESAGTGAWHVGEPPDSRMRRTASRYGLIYDGRAKQFKQHDFERFDLILAMDLENFQDLNMIARISAHREKLRLIREFDPMGGDKAGVPDPYYGNAYDFDEPFQIIDRSISGLIGWLEKDNQSDDVDRNV